MAFLGKNFHWFVGVVEDRHDPEKVGRLRVRCLGIHKSDKLQLPTADLPWASCVLPTTSAGISGLGQSPSFIVEGAWVWGYFRDGEQEPVVIGTLPGKPSELGNPNSGFYDPNRRSDDEDEVDYDLSVYPRNIDEPDTNRLAVNNAVYPYNHVFESESGHIKEYDDTEDHTRIHERHRSGTSYEFTHNGDRID